MATYYVNSGAGGAATGGSWTDAFLTLQAAATVATSGTDIIKVHVAHSETATASVTWTASCSTICVDKDASDALAEMGATTWIGNGGAFTLNGGTFQYFYGLTFRNGGSSTNQTLYLPGSDGSHRVYEKCYLWAANTQGAGGSTIFASGAGDSQTFVKFKECTFRFAVAAHRILVAGKIVMEGCSLSSAGTAPTTQVFQFTVADPGGCTLYVTGSDLSYAGSCALIGDSTSSAAVAQFSQCKLGTSYVMLATQTNLNRSSAEVYLFDCASGDTHGRFGYANAMGSVVSDTGIYFTAGAAAQSWKIVTTANCSLYTPFESPWFGYYNTGTSAITPYVEILRDGSATAYQDDEVWMDIAAKVTTTSTIATLYSDRMTLLGTAANQDAGAGLGSWTGEAGTAWSGKLALGSSITPAENGHIQARIVVGEPSTTVYADPQIRT